MCHYSFQKLNIPSIYKIPNIRTYRRVFSTSLKSGFFEGRT